MIRTALLAAAVAAYAGASLAQEQPSSSNTRTSVEQLGRASVDLPAAAPGEGRRPVEQLSARSAPTGSAQVGRRNQSTTPTSQLSQDDGGVRGAPQLSAGPVSAEAPAGPAPRGPRVTASAPVGGADRCDPQAGDGADPACRQVLETRSAEFARPEPGRLSPEQRILAEERARTERAGRSNADAVARGVMGRDVDDEIAAQALASATRPEVQARPEEPEEPALSVEAQALVNAIVAGATGGTGPIVVTPPR